MNRIFISLTCALCLCSTFGRAQNGSPLAGSDCDPTPAVSGMAGAFVRWEYCRATGKLTISGTGGMDDYEEVRYSGPCDDCYFTPASTAPWNDYASDIVSVEIANGVTSIGNYAFYNCENMASAAIPASVVSIGDWAFASCRNLPLICLDHVQAIGNGAFAWCRNLRFAGLDQMQTIGKKAFLNCNSLASITVPAGAAHIGSEAFDACYGLTSIVTDDANAHYSSESGVLYNKEKTLLHTYPAGKNDAAFIIPHTVRTIEAGAFHACRLTSVAIPAGVTEIGDGAFANCALSLTAVEVGWAVPPDIAIDTPNKHVFPGTYLPRITLIVPAGAREYYRAARGWTDFGRIIENVPVTIRVTGRGTVTSRAAIAAAGEIISLQVLPDAGYKLTGIRAYETASPNSLIPLDKHPLSIITQYSFTMPATAVTVEVAFTDSILTPRP